MNIIDRQNVITIFLEAAVDPVGLEDKSRFRVVRNRARSSKLYKYFALHQYDRRSKKDVNAQQE